MRTLTGGEPSGLRCRAPKTARTAQKIPSEPLSMNEIHFKMYGATAYEISRLVVAQEASDVESSSRLDFLLLHNLGRRFIA